MSYSCIHCEEEYAEKDFDGIFQVGNYINKAVCGECFWELLENISFRKKLTNKTKLQKLQDKIEAVAKINKSTLIKDGCCCAIETLMQSGCKCSRDYS